MNIDTLKEEISRYALTENLLNEILDLLKKEIIKNEKNFIEANKEDVKSNKKQVKLADFIEIIESYKKRECILNDDERKIVIYKGDPYLTLHLCLQALTDRTKVLLMQENFLYGVNEVLIKIIKKVYKNFKICNLIEKVEFSEKDFDKYRYLFDEVIVIGDTTAGHMLQENENVKFYPYHNIVLYCDSYDLQKLQEAIYIYANENEYEIEILYDGNIDDIIEIINNDATKNIAVLLTKNLEIKEKFVNKIKGKEIFVNENPFKNEKNIICNYLK